MTIIYSDKKIKNLEGCYIDPFRFDGSLEMGVTKVYTSNAKIREAYNEKCEVLSLRATTTKETKID